MNARHRCVIAVTAASLLALAGCTSEQAAPYGKAMFIAMVVLLIAIPIVFVREWRRRRGK